MFNKLFKKFAAAKAVATHPIAVRRAAHGTVRHVVQQAFEGLESRQMMSFAAPVSYAAGTSSAGMISADFNGDGNADIVTTNNVSNTANVLLGNGDGTFGAAIVSSLAASPGSPFTGSQAGTLAAGDFNGDGRTDISTVSSTNALILYGNGDGSFAAPITTSLGSSPSRISAADVNTDGRDDLLAANTDGTVAVVLSGADGTFSRTQVPAGQAAQDVKAVDLNHDGKKDLIVANVVSAGTVSVLMGNGDGSFQSYKSYPAFSAPYRMTIGDFDGDGNDDVAVANSYTSSYVTVLNGNGDGTLGAYHSYDTGSQPWELEAGDVDGDGKADLIDSNGSSYQIELNNGDGTFAAPTSTPGAGMLFAADDFNHDGTVDIAGTGTGTNAGVVGVMINNAVTQTNVSTVVGFQISAAATTVAGAPLPVTVSAIDASGNVVSDFLGTIHVVTSDPRMGGQTFTFVASDAGTHTFANGFALFTAGTQTIAVTGPAALTGHATANVVAAAPTKLGVVADATAVAGSPMSFTVTASDTYGNLASNYVGTVHLASTDGQAALPADYTFTADDAGVHTFAATLKTAGLKSISAVNIASATTLSRSADINVSPSVAVSLSIVGGGGHIGSSKIVTVTAIDAFGNIARSYNGTIHLTASDAGMILPADAALVNGIGRFSVTPMALGAQTLTAAEIAGSMSVTETINGTPGDAVRVVVSKIGNAVAGTDQTLTVTAYDAFGNVAVDYGGTIAFSSSDTRAALSSYTFSAADNGTHTFTVSLRTAGTQTLTAYDLFNAAITSTQTGIVITPAAAVTLWASSIAGGVAGTAQNVVVSARDAYGNVATSYRGTVAFSSTDTTALLPANFAFTAADAGTHTFSITLKHAGGNDVTIADTVNASMAVAQHDIQIGAAAMAGFAFRAPSNVSAGTAFALVVTAVDAYGNTIVGYTGKAHFTGPSGGGNLLPADYTFTTADAGSHSFNLTLSSTGTQSITVQDVLTAALKSTTQITVKTASGGGGGGGGSAGGGGGGGGGKKVV